DHDYTGEGDSMELTEIGEEHGMDHGDPTPYNTNWHNPIGELPGLADAQQVTQKSGYLAVVDADWDNYVTDILDEYIIKMIQGDLTPEDGVSQMHDELLDGGYIDE